MDTVAYIALSLYIDHILGWYKMELRKSDTLMNKNTLELYSIGYQSQKTYVFNSINYVPTLKPLSRSTAYCAVNKPCGSIYMLYVLRGPIY